MRIPYTSTCTHRDTCTLHTPFRFANSFQALAYSHLISYKQLRNLKEKDLRIFVP